MIQASFTPPSNAKEVQPARNMRMVGRGYPVIAGQSQIVSDGTNAFICLATAWTVFDAEDLPLVVGRRWGITQKSGRFYACSRRDYDAPKTTYLHRLILGASHGQIIDHRSGEGLDNRRFNLRFCTHAQNAQNQQTPITNTSGFKGAFFAKDKGLWYSKIRCDGEIIQLGYFSSAIEAHAAYAAAATKYHGDFARVA